MLSTAFSLSGLSSITLNGFSLAESPINKPSRSIINVFPSGHFFGDDVVTIDEVNAEKYGDTHLHVYKPNGQGDRGEEFLDAGETFIDGKFSLQNEGWFKEAVKQEKAVWSPVYNWQVEPFPLSVAHSRPIYDKNQNLVAVIAVEQQLSQISDFLRSLKVSPEGKTFIIERDGLLIGDSANEKPSFIL